jgi:cytochrome c oxidase subunit 4
MYAAGVAAVIILALSAAKFFSVVAYYMHLKPDHKLFTAIFVFPALLGTLVIVGMIMLFHVLPSSYTGHP